MELTETRQQIKLEARRLFATRGLDGVSIRDIAKAAGQKSSAAVNYHFGSKEQLIKEIIRDVAKMLDDDHNRRLDELESIGGPRSIREVVSILIYYPTMDSPDEPKDEYALRFLNMMLINRRELMFDALQGGVDRGTRRCMAHLRRFARDIPAVLLRQRLMLVISHLFAAASSREAALNELSRHGSVLWGHETARDNLIDTVEGILLIPPSKETLGRLDASQSPAPSLRLLRELSSDQVHPDGGLSDSWTRQ